MIASNQERNQFFLTTHNPYFLSALIEKTAAADLAVFVCSRDGEGATRAKRLDDKLDRGSSPLRKRLGHRLDACHLPAR